MTPPNQSPEPTAVGAGCHRATGSAVPPAFHFGATSAVRIASRRWLGFLLIAASTSGLSGCVSAGRDAYQPVAGMKGIEQKQPSPTADMTAMEKTGYYAGWLSLDLLYAWAGGNPTLSP